MEKKTSLIWIFLILLTAALACQSGPPATSPPTISGNTLIEVKTGALRGVPSKSQPDVLVYRGVPYAKPPVGALRWKAPQPPEPWDGIFEADSFGPACHQPSQQLFRGVNEDQNEDCLSLNVWTTGEENGPKPVMVWIHGGGFTTGSGAIPTYEGTQFAKSGVVLVTINYRLGPLGFFAHTALSSENNENISGNYGLLDQIAALEWVQRNISAFGGDPNNVTIFGESAGSVSVAYLLSSPLAKGLFHKAILQSGIPANPPFLRNNEPGSSSGEKIGDEMAEELGVSSSELSLYEVTSKLRAIPVDVIFETADPRIGLFGKGRSFGPVVDGYVLRQSALETFAAGLQHDVPILIGSNADEGTLFLQQIPIGGPTGYEWLVNSFFEENAQAVLDMFPAPTRAETERALADLVTTSAFTCPTRRAAQLLESQQSSVWMYQFTRVAPGSEKNGLRATHGAEIFYVFNNLPGGNYVNGIDDALAEVMQAAWVRFAATGNPNGSGFPDWPVVTQEKGFHLEFGDQPVARETPANEACELFDTILGY